MNWTGGRLSRHSKAKHSLRARQKQHFAKVQTNLRNGADKPNPLKLSFLGNIIESNAGSRHQSLDSNLSCSGRPVSPRRNDSHELQIPLYNNPHHESSPHRRQVKAPAVRESLLERRHNAVPDDDLYSATPLPLGRKRKYDLSIAQQEQESVLGNEPESTFERRRKILRKGDWVGVSIQRPLQLAFTSPNHAELVGKRRKIADNHRAKYNHKIQSFVRSPFTSQNQIHIPHNQRRQETGHLGMSDVRIAIGGREVPPGISSSSVTSRRREPSIHNYLFGSQRSSSDIMLLDNEENTRRRLQASEDRIYSGRETKYHGEWNVPRRSLAADIKDNEQEYESTWASGSQMGDGGRFHTTGGDVSATHGQHIVSSSTTSLQHPVPQSSRTSLLLRSDSAEITASIVAQAGEENPVVPSSRLVDNEIWESWVGPASDENSQQELAYVDGQRVSTRRIHISPGVSNAHVSRPVDRGARTEQSDEYVSTGPGWVRSSKDEDLSQHSSLPFLTSNQAIYERDSFSGIESGPGIRKKSRLAMETQPDVQANRRPQQVGHTAQPTKIAEESDLDNIWKKFVFGSREN